MTKSPKWSPELRQEIIRDFEASGDLKLKTLAQKLRDPATRLPCKAVMDRLLAEEFRRARLERIIAKMKVRLDELEHELGMLDPEYREFFQRHGATPAGVGKMIAHNYMNDREAHRHVDEMVEALKS